MHTCDAGIVFEYQSIRGLGSSEKCHCQCGPDEDCASRAKYRQVTIKYIHSPVTCQRLLYSSITVSNSTGSNALKFTRDGGNIHVKSYFIPESESQSHFASSGFGLGKFRNRVNRVYSVPAVAANKFGKIRIEFLDTGPGISEVTAGPTLNLLHLQHCTVLCCAAMVCCCAVLCCIVLYSVCQQV
jgi:hypothetical protein